jgi:hypothetical protein
MYIQLVKKYIVISIPVILVLVMITIFGRNVPHMDEMVPIDLVDNYHNNDLTFKRFFAVYNQHIMPLPNMIFLGVGLLFDYNILFLSYLIVIFHTLSFIFLLLIISKEYGLNFKDPPWWVSILSMLHFSLIQYTIFMFGFNISYILPLFFFYASLYFAICISGYNIKGIAYFLLVILLLIMGILSSAMGFFALPAILLVLIFRREIKFYSIPFILFSILIIYIIMILNNPIKETIDFDIVKFNEFFFTLIGLPFHIKLPAYYSGFLSLFVFIFLLYLVIKKKRFKSNLALISIITFCSLILLSIVYGRHNYPSADYLSFRYNAYKIPIYISLIIIFFDLIKNKAIFIKRIPQKTIIIITFSFYLFTSFYVFYRSAPKWAKEKEEYACIILNADIMPKEQLRRVYPNERNLKKIISIMKKYELNVFSKHYDTRELNCNELFLKKHLKNLP